MDHREPDQHLLDGALARRYVAGVWRAAALRHGMDEIIVPLAAPLDGHIDAPARTELLTGLIPTTDDAIIRRFAIQECARATRPQRGRSPSFLLCTAAIFHDLSVRADAEIIAAAIDALREFGLTPQHVKIRISHRDAVRSLLVRRGVDPDQLDAWFPLLHRAGKMSNDDFISSALEMGMEAKIALDVLRVLAMSTPFEAPTTQLFLSEQSGGRGPEYFKSLFAELRALGVADWCMLNLGIIRSGGHHTGMVFEIHDAVGRGRSIAGGGRSELDHDGIRSLVSYEMGDTALLELLRESGLLPETRRLADRLNARTHLYLVAADDPDAQASLMPTVAALRRTGHRVVTDTSPAADLADAQAAARRLPSGGARFAAIIEPDPASDFLHARIANLDMGTTNPDPVPLDKLADFLQ